MYTGPHLIKDNLVFGYDTGYPVVSGSSDTYRFNLGEPTTTLNVGDMTPSSPNTFFTSNATSHSNLHGTVWDWSYYPNSNISNDGGMEWHPEVKGPTFKGAWLMKKRPGGNSESNFSGNPPGAIDQTSSYTVSVWCKTNQANCFRIHINTTKNGSSHWGYSSGAHTGGGEWERLYITIPANTGNTSINVIRCQANSTNITADAYFRDYQVEKNNHATPFILNGTRSATQSLTDLKQTADIDLSNVSFDSNAQMTFDGTDDIINTGLFSGRNPSTDPFTIEAIVKSDTTSGARIWLDATSNGTNQRLYCAHAATGTGNPMGIQGTAWDSSGVSDTDFHHYVIVMDGSVARLYNNGEAHSTRNYTSYTLSGQLNVGGRNTYYWNGVIPVFKIHNQVLTADQVKQNYRAYKNRFGI
jgi:hypothetical protein